MRGLSSRRPRPDKDSGLVDVELAQKKQDLKDRAKYTKRVFTMVVTWLIVVLTIVIAEGCNLVLTPCCTVTFDLETSVLVALITTTTGSITGIFLIVMRYLFPRRGNE